MPLDADAQGLAGAVSQMLPQPIYKLGVDGARDFINAVSSQGPPPKELHAVSDRVIPGPHGDIPIRMYRPSLRTDLPVLVYLHGGGWTLGSPDSVDALCRELAAQADCVVVSVDYRLAPENKFPAGFDDCYAALEWVAGRAAEIGVDPGRIAIGGDSSGANLAAAVCVAARDRSGPPIVFQLLACPLTEYAAPRPSWVEHAEAPLLTANDVTWFWDQYLRGKPDRADWRATPSSAKSLAGLPPAYIATAEYDPIRDDGEQYAYLLRSAGVDVTLKRYPGVFHGFFTLVGVLSRNTEAVGDASALLREVFARQPADLA